MGKSVLAGGLEECKPSDVLAGLHTSLSNGYQHIMVVLEPIAD